MTKINQDLLSALRGLAGLNSGKVGDHTIVQFADALGHLAKVIAAAPELSAMVHRHLLELQTVSAEVPVATDAASTLPLDSTLEELGLLKEFPTRAQNVMKGEHILTLGELLAPDERDWLRTPNMGKVSLSIISAVVQEKFGCALGSLSEAQTKLYKLTPALRLELNSFVGIKLVREWQGELKQEFKHLGHNEIHQRFNRGEKLYETERADPALLVSLECVGIRYITELVTAPPVILTEVCGENKEWWQQLRMLIGRFGDDSYWYQGGLNKKFRLLPQFLEGEHVQLPIPTHLAPGVQVYYSKKTK